MATFNLITPERAKYNISVPASYTFTQTEEDVIAALIAACSAKFQNYCSGRIFQVGQYDEIYSGDLGMFLFLGQMPLVSVERVATTPMSILRIMNTSWPTNIRATVQVLSTGLKLVKVASGVTSEDVTVTWTANTTLAAVATAVNALGSGWSAEVLDTNYNTWPSDDLREIQGALSVANSNAADLVIYEEDINDFEVLEKIGALFRQSTWPRGHNNIRATFTAGFKDIPEDLQQACAIMVAGEFAQTKRDPMSATGKTADFMYNVSNLFSYPWPGNVLTVLSSYRLRMR